MNKLIIALIFSVFSIQAFAAILPLHFIAPKSGFLNNFSGASTTTTFLNPLLGFVIFAENGEAYADLNSQEAQSNLRLAVQMHSDGEELPPEYADLIEIFAQSWGVSHEEVIQNVAGEM